MVDRALWKLIFGNAGLLLIYFFPLTTVELPAFVVDTNGIIDHYYYVSFLFQMFEKRN